MRADVCRHYERVALRIAALQSSTSLTNFGQRSRSFEGVLPGLGKEVARYRAAAIAEAVEQVRPGYERVALRIAAALTELANAVEEEKRFIQPLLEKGVGDCGLAAAARGDPQQCLSEAAAIETCHLDSR